jgi:hypothetical protein
MSLQDKEQNCALCHARLFEDDDVVYCPICGAPHHRECYTTRGACALEEFHGTENQYDKLKRAQEEKQQEQQANTAEETQNGNYQTPFGSFSPIDFLGGVKPDTIIDEGVTAKDAAQFVFSNTMRFIPKFVQGRKASWNLLAFFFPGGWFLSRKMYKTGIVACLIEVISTLLTVPFQTTMLNLGIYSAKTSSEMAQMLANNITKFSSGAILALSIGFLLTAAIRVLSGIFADWLYRGHVIDAVREINAKSEDKPADFRKKGGVNLLAFLIGVLAIRYIPSIIVLFL